MSRDDERDARISLSCVIEPLDRTLAPLVVELGPIDAWEAIRTNAGNRFERGAARAAALDLDRVRAATDRLGARILIPGDEECPDGLDDLQFPPPALWVRGGGHLARLAQRSVAIVGARASTAYGNHIAGEFAAGLGDAGFTVVSGGAFGIDASAHSAALTVGAPTIAAMAGGVDRLYPAAHVSLIRQIMDDGLILAEVPPGWAPMAQRFLARNRLIAAIASGVVVVEAGLRSGSLNTVGHAIELNRPIGAVPGAVTSASSAGTNNLIRDAKATLVSTSAECVELLGDFGVDVAPVRRGSETVVDGLDEVPARVLAAMPLSREISIDRLALTGGLSAAEVNQGLGVLDLMGLIQRTSSGWKRARQRAAAM